MSCHYHALCTVITPSILPHTPIWPQSRGGTGTPFTSVFSIMYYQQSEFAHISAANANTYFSVHSLYNVFHWLNTGLVLMNIGKLSHSRLRVAFCRPRTEYHPSVMWDENQLFASNNAHKVKWDTRSRNLKSSTIQSRPEIRRNNLFSALPDRPSVIYRCHL